MTEKIIEFFAGLPGELYIFVISLLPIVELRGAISWSSGAKIFEELIFCGSFKLFVLLCGKSNSS